MKSELFSQRTYFTQAKSSRTQEFPEKKIRNNLLEKNNSVGKNPWGRVFETKSINLFHPLIVSCG